MAGAQPGFTVGIALRALDALKRSYGWEQPVAQMLHVQPCYLPLYILLTRHAAWAHDLKPKLDQCEMEVTRCMLCITAYRFPTLTLPYTVTAMSMRLHVQWRLETVGRRIPFSLLDHAMM